MSLSQRRNFRHKFVFAEGSTEYGPVPTSDEERQSPPSKRRKMDEKVEEANVESDEEMRQRWPNVREKFFLYTPAEVATIDSIDVLLRVQDLYSPSSQPHTEEEFQYTELVAKAADARLLELQYV